MRQKTPKKPDSSAGDVTPLMRQYLDQKALYPDAILLFRVGDFYEMFYEDAQIAAEALGLQLTSRDKNRENPVPLAGVPYHALKTYLSRLLDQGFKVAVCEQLEDPKDAKGVVRRGVTQVVTPGLILDEEQLDARIANYLAATIPDVDQPDLWGLALADISTGEFRVSAVHSTSAMHSEIGRVAPREVLTPEAVRKLVAEPFSGTRVLVEPCDDLLAGLGDVPEFVCAHALAPLPPELEDLPCAMKAAAVAMAMLHRARPAETPPPVRVVWTTPGAHMTLDAATIGNLELFETLREKKRDGAIVQVLDRTVTAMGGRLLRSWMMYPLLEVGPIRRRQDAVGLLHDRADLREAARLVLRQMPDLERLVSRAAHQVATPRDLGTLRRGLGLLPLLLEVEQALGTAVTDGLPELLRVGDDLCVDLLSGLGTLVEEPPVLHTDGEVFLGGVNAKLDELIDLTTGGRQSLLEIEEKERRRTGIGSLKINYNRVFGYFIEISRSRTQNVPEDYVRKQTMRNAERYITAELAELEGRVLAAQEERTRLEAELFVALRETIAAQQERLLGIARRIATLDVLAGLAEVAHRFHYHRPLVDTSDKLELSGARHPVIERNLGTGEFIPNDLKLSGSERQVLVITGPNMAGKSTIIRQAAIIQLMAQMGSFVPVDRAQIGLCDRIFTRVGASDNISRGESTFMVEMKETAGILRHATSRSLVILDEIGRGTSTYDGVSIAWAVAEFVHDRIGCRTLFATHYHELTALPDIKPRIHNAAVAVREWKGEIVFLRKLVNGSVNRSYGIHVASLAGVPAEVITRARSILKSLEDGESLTLPHPKAAEPEPQLSLFAPPPPVPGQDRISERLRAVEPDTLSPREALQLIYDLISMLD
ncbi:DNA mismatch repair protein MutS [Myxococcota bacterium]|nr:DNA mismatch repair protein MutS [Myxococcota bacterium]MBU1412096.1 DNA mismatch repair protein MutS [Myxococcota bacterium]MBU1510806.1 DNA mismatch repair protein MutS [Myxococcota bacterium]